MTSWRAVGSACLALIIGCASQAGRDLPAADGSGGAKSGNGGAAAHGGGDAQSGDGGSAARGGGAVSGKGGSAAEGGDDATSGTGGRGGNGGGARSGSGGAAADGGSGCASSDKCQVDTWIDVTPPELDRSVLRPSKDAYGPGSIVADPARPSDLYVGGSKAGLWRSTDYGSSWKLVNKTLPDVPRGVTIAVAGTTPATVWAASYNVILKSTDAGETFKEIKLDGSLYSLQVDPYDADHLISGLHEADGLMESSDAGETWHRADGAGWPSGGVSFYPFFIDTGDAASTRDTWLVLAQNGATPVRTRDAGKSWSKVDGIVGLQHPHGNAQLFQSGSLLFLAGVEGPGQGVYRSGDLGASWQRVDSGDKPQAMVWGTSKHVYAMYAWACSNCELDTAFQSAALPGGDSWSHLAVPGTLKIGPNSVAVTHDGTHAIAVAVMWDQGIWRYVED